MIGDTTIVVDQDCDDCERCDNCDHIRPVAKTKPLKDNETLFTSSSYAVKANAQMCATLMLDYNGHHLFHYLRTVC